MTANIGECRCNQQRMCWLYGISEGLVIFENYLKKNFSFLEKTLKKCVIFSIIFMYHLFYV